MALSTTAMTGRAPAFAALLLAFLPLARAAAATPEPVASEETRSVIAGRRDYDRSGYYKFHFGEGYRKLWTTPFAEKVLDLRTFAGGLTAVRQVGSMQSLGLALKGADGTFRSLGPAGASRWYRPVTSDAWESFWIPPTVSTSKERLARSCSPRSYAVTFNPSIGA